MGAMRGVAAVLALALAAGQAAAREPDVPAFPEPISDAQLDTIRGGFEVWPGVRISFGIENVVFTNGALVSRTTFTLDPAVLDHLHGIVQVVRNGVPTSETLGASDLAIANVIQNSLDSQLIQSLSVLDASVQGLDALRALRLDEVYGRQMIDLP